MGGDMRMPEEKWQQSSVSYQANKRDQEKRNRAIDKYVEESCESLQILQILFLGFFVIFMWQKFAATPAKLLFGIRILEEKGLTNPSKAIAFWAFYSTYLYCHYIAKAITDQQ